MNTYNMATVGLYCFLTAAWLHVRGKGKVGKMMVIKHLVSNHGIRKMSI
jgi:hypothetical protein